MKRRTFLIPTLLAAGFTAHDEGAAAAPALAPLSGADPNSGTLLKLFKQDHAVILADHRSHSSHSSHRSSSGGGGGHYSHTSHASHRSSTGGSYSYPTPTYVAPSYSSPPAPPPQPQRPSALIGSYGQERATTSQYAAPVAQARTLSGRTNQFKTIVKRVQIALLARDLYSGGIDGEVGPALRSALRKFQSSNNLSVTGTITPEVLDGLRVATEG